MSGLGNYFYVFEREMWRQMDAGAPEWAYTEADFLQFVDLWDQSPADAYAFVQASMTKAIQ